MQQQVFHGSSSPGELELQPFFFLGDTSPNFFKNKIEKVDLDVFSR
jgi:hypothetical protein